MAGDAMSDDDRLREALRNIRDAILVAHQNGTLTDTLWMLNPCPETVVDYIEAALGEGVPPAPDDDQDQMNASVGA